MDLSALFLSRAFSNAFCEQRPRARSRRSDRITTSDAHCGRSAQQSVERHKQKASKLRAAAPRRTTPRRRHLSLVNARDEQQRQRLVEQFAKQDELTAAHRRHRR